MPSQITLYDLSSSRSIRIAFLLELLGLEYSIVHADRQSDSKAPAWIKKESGNPLGKFPTLKDHSPPAPTSSSGEEEEVIIYESGAIVDYLLTSYDTQHRLLPEDRKRRIQVQTWVHAAEGTFMLHALALVYAAWFMPESGPGERNEGLLKETQRGQAENVRRDLNWLEAELANGERRWLAMGESLTVADVMMVFSVDYILQKGLARPEKGMKWERVERWLDRVKEQEAFKIAVKKTGYHL